MILEYTRNNKTYSFNAAVARAGDMDYPLYLVGTVGFGLSPAHHLTQRGPFQQGDSYIGLRLDPRIIQLPLVVVASSAEDSFSKRAKLASLFRISDDVVTVRMAWTDSTGTYDRSIQGRVLGQLSLDTDGEFYTIRTSVQIRCNDPTWYDSTQTTAILTSTLFGTPTLYPKPYPVFYGAAVVNKITTINYAGTWDAYPIIQITGPATNLVISDTLNHAINFLSPVPAGALWTINLGYGVYTVLDEFGVNQFSALASASDLVNWRVFAESDLVPNGVNTISVSATGTDAETNVTMYYTARYIGV
jgi:hypothetical protein